MPDPNELLLKEDKVKIKSCIYALQRDGLPPVTTHNVTDDYNDPVLNALRRCRLFNTIHDRVKVSFFKNMVLEMLDYIFFLFILVWHSAVRFFVVVVITYLCLALLLSN